MGGVGRNDVQSEHNVRYFALQQLEVDMMLRCVAKRWRSVPCWSGWRRRPVS